MTAGIFYATREGQTRKVAERIAHALADHEFTNWPLLDRYVADVVAATRTVRA